MNPAVKYTLARLGLFVVVYALLLLVDMNVLLRLMIAILFSATLSWFLLRGLREKVAHQVEGAVQRRREEKERLQAALAGEDDEPSPRAEDEPER